MKDFIFTVLFVTTPNVISIYFIYFRSVADRFGIAKDTVWKSVFEVAVILATNTHHYIKWPAVHEMVHIEEEFRAITGFPGVIGAIDGCHIQISAPIQDANSYINRKGYYSILLQGICDSKLKFIDVFIGMCGSVHDARVWDLSDIKRLTAANNHRYFNEFYHLLADSAYPLSNRMLTSYRDNGHLDRLKINYNRKHARTRVIIERVFGLLTGRFRKLKYVYMYATDLIPLIVLACCVLHNICIDVENNPLDMDPIDLEEIDNALDNYVEDLEGDVKRDIIAHLLL